MTDKLYYHARAASGTGSTALCGVMSAADALASKGAPVNCPRCLEMLNRDTPKKRQVGGSHYKELAIQPWDVMQSISTLDPERFSPYQWHLLFTSLKYIMRAGAKGPAAEDIAKAIHYLETLKEELE